VSNFFLCRQAISPSTNFRPASTPGPKCHCESKSD
jgi:hypothetical protein